MIHAAATSARSTSPAHRFPPMAASLSPDLPLAPVRDPSQIPSATLSFCINATTALGTPSGWTGGAAVRVLAAISPQRLGIPIAGPISVFTPAQVTTGSLVGWITTHLLPIMGDCIFPGTTLL